jgi:CheY-like chemotaxis protein
MRADHQSPHILCIDHSPEILSLLRDLLEEEGFRVTTEDAADKDLDRIAELAPDLITLDYVWSNLDDDWCFLQRLRLDRRMRAIPIVLCTGAVREVQALRDHLRDMDVEVVYKPFDIEQFLEAVSRPLGRSPLPFPAHGTRAETSA